MNRPLGQKSGAESAATAVSKEAALWARLTQGGAAAGEARRALFAAYLPLARGVAGRHFARRSGGDIEYADLYQFACAGLLEAIDRFKPDLGVPFAGFARKRVTGSVLDGIATTSEIRAQLSFRNRLKRERSRSLGGDALDRLSGEDAMQALVDMSIGLAIGFMLEGTTLYVDDNAADPMPNAYESAAWSEMVERVLAEVEKIGGRERDIIRYHYFDGLDFTQIASLLDLSKGRISQLHRQSMLLLRKRLRNANIFRLKG
ncbi:MAG: sigma-70 family RNA polymerase sigma factor [Pseudomonadota bacterium]